MQEYERSISLRTIYITLVRRIELILLIFVPIELVAFVVTNFILPKSYTSTTTLALSSGTITPTVYNDYQVKHFKSEATISTVYETLKNDGVKHVKGGEITKNEISGGIAFSTLANSNAYSFAITFKSSDSSITKAVLSQIADKGLESLKTADPNTKLYISASASDSVKTSKENTYFLIAIVGGLVLACGIPFVYEIVSDRLYDRKDLAVWGAEGFELKVTKNK